MPTFEFTSPEGKTYTVEGPQGATKEQAFQILQSQLGGGKAPEQPKPRTMGQELVESIPVQAAMGALRGAGSIGATLMRPFESGEENTRRRTAMDEALRSMGADTSGISFGAGKLGTEIAGTAGIGGLLGMGARGLGAAPAVVNALTTGGLRGGAGVTGAANVAKDIGLRTGAGAVVGGASAGTVNPEDAGMGAVIGGVLPGALQATGAVAKPIGRAFSKKMAESEVLAKIKANLGVDDAAKLQQGDIPLSAAALTQNPALARMEQTSRLKSPETWYGFDQTQGKAVFDKMMKATDEAAEISQRALERRNNWNANWADVESAVKPSVFNARIPKFADDIEIALQSSESVNPSVRGFLEAIKGEIARFGNNFSPAHLQQIRANLSGRYNPMNQNAYANAPRESKAVQSVLREVDDILNESTGGVWAKVPAAYKADSVALHEAKAASKVRGAFVDQDTGRTLGKSLDVNGDIPKITEVGLGRAMNAARMPGTKDLALSGRANNELENILLALRNQDIVQGVKRSATAGGGSDTASNLTALMPSGTGKNLLRDALMFTRDFANRKESAAIAELLTNPQELRRLLSRQPSEGNQLLQLLSRGAPIIPAQ